MAIGHWPLAIDNGQRTMIEWGIMGPTVCLTSEWHLYNFCHKLCKSGVSRDISHSANVDYILATNLISWQANIWVISG